MSGTLDRRSFLAAGATLTLSAASYDRVLRANDKIRLGFIGTGGRGRSLMKSFLKDKDVEIVAVCDTYEPYQELAVQEAGGKAKAFTEFRQLLDDKTINAVVIATPDHQHQPQLLASLRARKDVYIEKPLSLSVEQGNQMVKAVKNSEQIVQVGLQRRSSALLHQARKVIRDGDLGAVSLVRAQWFWNMPRLAKARVLKGKLHWKEFCGPAGNQELTRDGYQNVAFWNWRYFWAFSGGNMTDQGTHLLDVVQWFLNDGKPPKSAVCQGRVARLHPAETPDVFSATFEFPEFLCTWTLAYTSSYEDGWKIIFQGEKATMELDGKGFRVFPDAGRGKPPVKASKEVEGTVGTDPHVENFLECVRDRRATNAPIEVGHNAVIGPHLANYSLRKGCRAVLGADGRISAE
jgi:predicted dehydrogenase